jgi:lipopolysaccharide biosynthesis protein
MRRPLLASAACAAFWDGVGPLLSKEEVVDRLEIGLSEHFVRHGFRIAAVYDARAAGPMTWREILPHLSPWQPARSRRHLRKARRTPHNPSELAWRRLLDAGVPFVKVGLFRVNHYGLDLDRVLRGIAASTPYDIGLIRHHLRRIGRA